MRQFYLDNKTQQQIAEALGISQSYVRSMIQTGLLSMRTCTWLNEYRQRQYSRAYYGTESSFRHTGSSITEQIVINIDTQERQLKAYLSGGECDSEAAGA